jgi:hypothetical protein
MREDRIRLFLDALSEAPPGAIMPMEVKLTKDCIVRKIVDGLNAELGVWVKDQNDGCPGISRMEVYTRVGTGDMVVVNKKGFVTAADFDVVIHVNKIRRSGAAAQDEVTGTKAERPLELKDMLSSGRLLAPAKNVFAWRENVATVAFSRDDSLGGIDKFQSEERQDAK